MGYEARRAFKVVAEVLVPEFAGRGLVLSSFVKVSYSWTWSGE